MVNRSFTYVYDPNLPESYEEQLDRQFRRIAKIWKAEEKIERGRDQVKRGELRAEITKTFLSSFPSEVSQHFEQRIVKIRSIKGEKKFRGEVVSLLLEIYLIGIHHGAAQPEAVNALRKKYFPQS